MERPRFPFFLTLVGLLLLSAHPASGQIETPEDLPPAPAGSHAEGNPSSPIPITPIDEAPSLARGDELLRSGKFAKRSRNTKTASRRAQTSGPLMRDWLAGT